MEDQFSRTRLLLGDAGLEKLARARVAVFGLGGVGGYAVEALARGGVGALDLIDHDQVSVSNLNRQIFALRSTVGRFKADVARERVLEINPLAQVRSCKLFFTPDSAGELDFSRYDYIVDAIDTVTCKLALAEQARDAGVPIISAMGAGNKLDPTAFEVADISQTSMCPLARVMRKELKKRGIIHMKVVYSREPPMTPLGAPPTAPGQKPIPGSVPFVPSVAGLILAGEVMKDICAGR